MGQTEDESALRIWSDKAPYWAKHRDFINAFLGPVTPVLVEEAGIRPGHGVLDVAGGATDSPASALVVSGRNPPHRSPRASP